MQRQKDREELFEEEEGENNMKFTDENRAKLQEAAAWGASIEEMAFFCGITKKTIYNWFEKDPAFAEEVERLRETPILKARRTIVEALNDPEHAKWFLARKRKKEFSERQEYTGGDDENGNPRPILVQFIDGDNKNTN